MWRPAIPAAPTSLLIAPGGRHLHKLTRPRSPGPVPRPLLHSPPLQHVRKPARMRPVKRVAYTIDLAPADTESGFASAGPRGAEIEGVHVEVYDKLIPVVHCAADECEYRGALGCHRPGPSEFNITGTLKTWSVLDKLHTIEYPTLVMNGVDDEAQDECVRPFFERIPKMKWVQFAENSHMPFFEEKERYLSVVENFLEL